MLPLSKWAEPRSSGGSENENLPRARLTLHAVSALKPQSRQGRLSGSWIRSGNREISVSRILGLENES